MSRVDAQKLAQNLGIEFHLIPIKEVFGAYRKTLKRSFAGKKPDINRIVREKLKLVGLEGTGDKMPSELSGGMRKRVGLARAICLRPKIMLYDEPTTGVDPIMGDAINDLIVELHNKLKVTGIAVTHDMSSAYKIASRMAMLYNGKIITVGTPDEIKSAKDPVVRQFISGAAKGPITEGIDYEHLI